ncbi:MAG: hypothetical protein CM15mV19_0870 [uncultured marine virus]|nr:MAG: hypothetical protein CM15mV19_0870 [uncultured marine virus]
MATKASMRKVESTQEANPLLLDDENANNYYEILVNGEYQRVQKELLIELRLGMLVSLEVRYLLKQRKEIMN